MLLFRNEVINSFKQTKPQALCLGSSILFAVITTLEDNLEHHPYQNLKHLLDHHQR